MELNRMIDHTLLKANATRAQIEKLCDEALEYNFASVCVNTCWVPLAHEKLAGSEVKTCCVVGFPLGAMLTEAKAAETRLAVEAGADEVDMVINIGDAKMHNFKAIEDEIKALREAAGDKILKVIIETCYLTDEEKIELCKCVTNAKADFIKTSTGFGTDGATVHDVKLFKEHVGPNVKIKAAGGMSTLEDIYAFMELGCDRLGTSRAIGLLKNAK